MSKDEQNNSVPVYLILATASDGTSWRRIFLSKHGVTKCRSEYRRAQIATRVVKGAARFDADLLTYPDPRPKAENQTCPNKGQEAALEARTAQTGR